MLSLNRLWSLDILDRLDWLNRLDRLNRLDKLDRLDELDRLVRLVRLDRLDRLDWLDILDRLDRMDTLDILDTLDGLDGVDWLGRLLVKVEAPPPPGFPGFSQGLHQQADTTYYSKITVTFKQLIWPWCPLGLRMFLNPFMILYFITGGAIPNHLVLMAP